MAQFFWTPVATAMFFLVGSALVVGAVFTGFSTMSFATKALRAEGEVVSLLAGGSHPEIAFKTAKGQSIAFPQGGFIFGYRPGDKAPVLYDAADPRSTARVDEFGALWFAPAVLLFLGLLFIAIGLQQRAS